MSSLGSVVAVAQQRRRVSAFANVGTALVFAGCFALVGLARYRLSSDGFMTLFAGREVATHGIPTHNLVSAEAHGARWVDQQWLAQWLFFRAWAAGGYGAVAALATGLVAAAYAAFARLLLLRGASLRRALKWTTLTLACALPDIATRAQAFGFLCFAIVFVLLVRERPLATLPVLVLWANLHGSVLLGALGVAAYCGWRRRPAYLGLAVVALATPLATPYGIHMLSYYRATLANGAIRSFAAEWQPAVANNLAACGLYALLLAVAWVVVRGRSRLRAALPLAPAAAVLTAGAFTSIRWAGFAAFPLTVVATDLLGVTEPTAAPTGRTQQRAALAAAALGGIALLTVSLHRAPFVPATPTAAAAAVDAYAARHPRARILADDASASALLWLYPDLRGRVGLDDRLELYPQATVRAWASFIRGEPAGWQALAARYRLVVASTTNDALVRLLRRSHAFRLLHRDPAGVVYVRA